MKITDEQLEINQNVVDLIYQWREIEEEETSEFINIDPKSLIKYLWNNGYKFTKRL